MCEKKRYGSKNQKKKLNKSKKKEDDEKGTIKRKIFAVFFFIHSHGLQCVEIYYYYGFTLSGVKIRQ